MLQELHLSLVEKITLERHLKISNGLDKILTKAYSAVKYKQLTTNSLVKPASFTTLILPCILSYSVELSSVEILNKSCGLRHREFVSCNHSFRIHRHFRRIKLLLFLRTYSGVRCSLSSKSRTCLRQVLN